MSYKPLGTSKISNFSFSFRHCVKCPKIKHCGKFNQNQTNQSFKNADFAFSPLEFRLQILSTWLVSEGLYKGIKWRLYLKNNIVKKLSIMPQKWWKYFIFVLWETFAIVFKMFSRIFMRNNPKIFAESWRIKKTNCSLK